MPSTDHPQSGTTLTDGEGKSVADRVGEYNIIGTPFRRVDGRAKVTGMTKFADDISFPRMVHMRIHRSTRPHALIRDIDTSKAAGMPGVLGFITGDQMPNTFGIQPSTSELLLSEAVVHPDAGACRHHPGSVPGRGGDRAGQPR